MDLYQQNILDYYRHPRKQGKLEKASLQGASANPLCGDRVELQLEVNNEKIIRAGWNGEGCVLSLVAADMLAEGLEGKFLKDLATFNKDWIVKKLGVNPSPSRMKCALLTLEALTEATIKH